MRDSDSVSACDPTAGEMGSNGTADERVAEAEEARKVLGARWRINLRLPDRAYRLGPGVTRWHRGGWSGVARRVP